MKDGKYNIFQIVTNPDGAYLGKKIVDYFVIKGNRVTETSPNCIIQKGPITWRTELSINQLNNGYQVVKYESFDGPNSELEKGAKGDWRNEGYTLSHEMYDADEVSGLFNPKHHSFTVHVKDKQGQSVGKVIIGNSPTEPMITSLDTNIHPDHRRKGLATAAYKHAELVSGKKMKPSTSQTVEGEALWQQPVKNFGKSNALKKGSAQRRIPFNPADVPHEEHRQHVEDWTAYAEPQYRNSIPRLEGNARKRALHKLGSQTNTRIGESGEREFLLFRGNTAGDFNHGLSGLSSFTPKFDHAKRFADEGQKHLLSEEGISPEKQAQVKQNHTIHHAWVPESAIHHIPNAIGTQINDWQNYDQDHPKKNHWYAEHEVIINTPKVKIHTENADVAASKFKSPQTDVNTRIIARASGLKKSAKEYKEGHEAPTNDETPLHDLSGAYHSDIYGSDAHRLYGTHEGFDHESISKLQSAKGRPNAPIKVYRAVPKILSNSEKIEEYENHKKYILKNGKVPPSVKTSKNRSDYFDEISSKIDHLKSLPEEAHEKMKINPGDWVTGSLSYAKDHGRNNLKNSYRILSKTVPAKHLFTDGNSVHEWGYDPTEKIKKSTPLQKDQGDITFPKQLPKWTRPREEIDNPKIEVRYRKDSRNRDRKLIDPQAQIKAYSAGQKLRNAIAREYGGDPKDQIDHAAHLLRDIRNISERGAGALIGNPITGGPLVGIGPAALKPHEGIHWSVAKLAEHLDQQHPGPEWTPHIYEKMNEFVHPDDKKLIADKLKNMYQEHQIPGEYTSYLNDIITNPSVRQQFMGDNPNPLRMLRMKRTFKNIRNWAKNLDTDAFVNEVTQKYDIAKSESLEKGLKGDWKKEGYTFSHRTGVDSIDKERKEIRITAHDKNGNLAGQYTFTHHPDFSTISPELASTHENHQRKGLASHAYTLAEDISGKRMDHSGGYQSEDAKLLWNNPSREFGKSSDLEKAVQPKDINRLKTKTNTSAPDLVDHAPFEASDPASENYKAMLNDPKQFKGEGIRQFGGISAKMVHKVGDETYMSKPYHKKIESATRSWCKHPVLGWASMATKHMFHAAGMGDNVEDVSVHTHQGVPMTVHKFDKGAKPLPPARRDELRDPGAQVQGHKIAILDYLSNNLDRHHGNILYNPEENKLLAIDHERSFQYEKPISNFTYPFGGNEIPRSYLTGRALREFKTTFGDEHSEEIGEWWGDHKDAIKDSFYKNLEHIKDPYVKNHMKTNFDSRWDLLSDFANHDPASIFHKSFFPEVKMHKERLPVINEQSIRAKLSEDPVKNIKSIDAYLGKKRGAKVARSMVQLWKDQIDKMHPDQVAEYYKSKPRHHHDNNPGSATHALLTHLEETKNEPAIKKLMEHVPEWWQDRFKRSK